MPTQLADVVHDAALNYLADNTTHIVLMSGYSMTYNTANGSEKLGSVAVTPGNGNGDFVVEDRTAGGRQCRLVAQSGVSVSVTGTMTHIGFLDSVNLAVLHTQALSASVAVTAGSLVNVPELTLASPDVVVGA